MTTQSIDPTILDRLTIAATNLRALAGATPAPEMVTELDELDSIVTALTPPPTEDPTPGKPDWLAAGCCGGLVNPEAHGPGIETWPGSPDQFWCTGWDPAAQPATDAPAEEPAP